jgi:thiol-disulfide isomerase/thioredoxin
MKNGNQLTMSDKIQNRIYTIRGVQVMLDKDLAELYQVRPIRLREQVKRNINRFPSDFMFQLNEEDVDFMVSQNAIPSRKYLGGHLPYVFTEQGIASISGILTSEISVKINIQVMRAFVEMRKFITANASVFGRLDSLELKQLEQRLDSDKKFNQLFDALESGDIKPRQGIFYNGQVFDAYVFASKIVKSAKKLIILIDNFVDESVLQLLTKRAKGIKVVIYTKNISKVLKQDLEKHNSQYEKIEIKKLKKAHDRFLIIDKKIVYHFGASLKDLGTKWFAFSKLEMDAGEIVGRLNEE